MHEQKVTMQNFPTNLHTKYAITILTLNSSYFQVIIDCYYGDNIGYGIWTICFILSLYSNNFWLKVIGRGTISCYFQLVSQLSTIINMDVLGIDMSLGPSMFRQSTI